MATVNLTGTVPLASFDFDVSQVITELGAAQTQFNAVNADLSNPSHPYSVFSSPTELDITLLSGSSDPGATLILLGAFSPSAFTVTSLTFTGTGANELDMIGSLHFNPTTGALTSGSITHGHFNAGGVEAMLDGHISISGAGAISGSLTHAHIETSDNILDLTGALTLTAGGTAVTGGFTEIHFSDSDGDSIDMMGLNPAVAKVSLFDSFTDVADAAQSGAFLTGNDTITASVAGGATLNAGAGNDTVTVTTADAYTIFGGIGIDILNGNAGNDTLNGGAGNDTLNGGGGFDTLIGGLNNDTYLVGDTNATITENFNEGTDTVVASVDFSMFSVANVENLTLTGAAVDGFGNNLINVITGNNNGDVLYGYGGNDTLNGGTGNDFLIGGDGNDILNGGDGNDSLFSEGGNDKLNGGNGNDYLEASGSGRSTLAGGADNDTYGVDGTSNGTYDMVTEALNAGTDQVDFSGSGTYVLAANVEYLQLLDAAGNANGTGNALDNQVIGNNSGDNILLGLAGNDMLNGFDGNDTLNGGLGNDTLYGGNGNDTLTGGAGNDFMYGQAGNDTYVLDNASELGTVFESLGEGNDTLKIAFNNPSVNPPITVDLSAGGAPDLSNFENVTILGTGLFNVTGNDLGDILTGNASANVLLGGLGNDTLTGLAGNDTLNGGGGGTDTLTGGLGNDTYVVNSAGATIVELANGGTADTVRTTVDNYVLDANVENLTLAAGAAITGTGNALNNVITGNDNGDTLAGGLGLDKLIGGTGADTLDGGLGKDTLTGGTGADTFVFSTAPAASNVDTITDFTGGVGGDTLEFENSVFTALGLVPGPLDPSFLHAAAGLTTAQNPTDHLIYNTTTGNLYYDADGQGGVAAVQVATLTNHPTLTATDIHII
jgi:Ca2+-binding RTX toxin-like protein